MTFAPDAPEAHPLPAPPPVAPADPAVADDPFLAPLWPIGVVVLAGVLAFLVSPTRGEALEWRAYVLLGSVCPALVLGIGLATRGGGAAARATRLLAGLVAAVALALYVAAVRPALALPLAALTVGAGALLVDAGRPTARGLATGFLVAAATWTGGLALICSQPAPATIAAALQSRLPDALVALPLALLLVLLGLRPAPAAAGAGRAWLRRLATLAGLVPLALASVRADAVFWIAATYHWGPIVGAAELVRQGGWLLWDVPMHYGLLNTLAVALLPVTSVWNAFYRFDAALLFVSATLLFLLLRALRRGPANFAFALLVSLSAVFWLPGLLGATLEWSSPLVTPAPGPFRFLPCQLLIALPLGVARARTRRGRRALGAAAVAAWLVGVFWSAESAVYGTVTFLPAWTILVWGWAGAGGAALGGRLRRTLLPAAAPLALLALLLAGVDLYYRARLGAPPDWYAFYEFAAAVRGGKAALRIQPLGSWSVLAMVFCAGAIAWAAATDRRASARTLAPLAAAWGALWATDSYFIGRSADVNATNLLPMQCTALAVVLLALRDVDWRSPGSRLVHAIAVVLFTATVTLAVGTGRWTSPHAWEVRGRYALDVDDRLGDVEDESLTRFVTGTLGRDQPIVMLDRNLRARFPAAWRRLGVVERTWLPMLPFEPYELMAVDRRQLYMARFVRQHPQSGWIVREKGKSFYSTGNVDLRWFYAQLLRTHHPTRIVQNERWAATWWQLRSEAAAAP